MQRGRAISDGEVDNWIMREKKIGIFINYAPEVKLTTEGLGRYLGTLMKGFQQAGGEVIIACPQWLLPSLQELEQDLQIEADKIGIITTDGIPPIWRIYRKLTKKKKRNPSNGRWRHISQECILRMAERTSWDGLILDGITLGVISAGMGIGILVKKIIQRIGRICTRTVQRLVRRFDMEQRTKISRALFQRMLEHSEKTLVKRINTYKDPVDVWYVPALFWPEVNKITNGKVVINVPDLVTQEFPTGFVNLASKNQTEACRRSIEEGTYFVSYCEYVGNELINNQYGGRGKVCYSIQHANHDLMPYIEIPADVAEQMNLGGDKNLTTEFAKSVIAGIPVRSGVLTGRQLANTRYLFYATQFRPNKNLITLLEAYRQLIRYRFQHIRLVLTGDPDNFPEIMEYLNKHDMLDEVVFCVGVSSQELAALYHCAELVVTTTLYEGGFPFTFGEGMSVGTPSIMSNIRQVREVLEPAGLEFAMFDATDEDSIVEKIIWALNHRDELYEKELPLYQQLAKRTDKLVAEEYMGVFETILSA